MLIQRANLYQLEPTPEQAEAFGQWAGACRALWNAALEQRQTWGRNHGLNKVTQDKELTALRQQIDWVGAVPVHCLQSVVQNLDDAFQRFFCGLGGFPNFKKKHRNESLHFKDKSYLGFRRYNGKHGAVKIPKVGWVKLRGWRALGGELRSVTIKKKAGRWYAAVQWQQEMPDPPKIDPAEPVVGIDRGVAVWAATSVGELIDPVNAGKAALNKRAKLQRKLARKRKFSNNWRKVKQKIARLDSTVANVRRDFVHKRTTEWSKSHAHTRMEKLQVRNMSASAAGTVEAPGKNVAQKSGLNRSILDQGWGMADEFMRYKQAERGHIHDHAPAPYTSLRCPQLDCGHCSPNNRPTRDRFCCEVCGYENHADVVGAINVSQARALAVEPPKRIRRRVGKRKQPKEVARAAA